MTNPAKCWRVARFAALVCASLGLAGGARGQGAGPPDSAAADAFKAGKFADAEKLYARAAAADANDYEASVRLGEIALLSNRFSDAERWLRRTLEIRADDARAKTLLAEMYCRQDDFARAAEIWKTAGTGGFREQVHFPSLDYDQMASFKGLAPYQVDGPGEAAHLKFVKVDPLPLATVRINGGREALFFVDTGGGEIGLDTEFAKELGLPLWPSKQGETLRGGSHGQTFHSKIDSIGLGQWTVKNVPAAVEGLRALSSMLGVPRIDGVIGTIFLYHFLATIDYRAGELVLQKRTAENTRRLWVALGRRSVSAPFWMAGDHFMVAWGRVGAAPPTLFFLDSGLAGAGVDFPESTLRAANAGLEKSDAEQGQAAAETFQAIPHPVPEVSFAGVTERNVPGLRDGSPSWEQGLGFHIGGMIGHEFLRSHAVTLDFDGMMVVFH